MKIACKGQNPEFINSRLASLKLGIIDSLTISFLYSHFPFASSLGLTSSVPFAFDSHIHSRRKSLDLLRDVK